VDHHAQPLAGGGERALDLLVAGLARMAFDPNRQNSYPTCQPLLI